MIEKKIKKRRKKKSLLIFLKLVLIILLISSLFYLFFYSGVFNIKNIEVSGNKILTSDEIIKLTKINSDNILLINFEDIKSNLINEVYISDAKLKRKFPSTVNIDIIERVESILLKCNDIELILDFEGVPLRYNVETSNNLFELKIDQDIYFNMGEKIELSNSDIKFNDINELIYYINLNNYGFVEKISVINNNVYIYTEFGTEVKLDYKNDMKYQIVFTKEIINDRMNQNQNVLGLIDFTKGENPVYTNFDDMEVRIEE